MSIKTVTIDQNFMVSFNYPVHFTRGVFDPGNSVLAGTMDRLGEGRRHRAVVILDQGVQDAHPGLVGKITRYFQRYGSNLELVGEVIVVRGGPAAKRDYEHVRQVMHTIGERHLDRQSFVVAVGGGSVLDMAGFAASIVHRGLRLVRIPTTTLAQNDAGVGVKNGMDEHGQKNFVGTFAPPFAVINDSAFLTTLAREDWLAGVAEAFKVAIIKDRSFFGRLQDLAARLNDGDLEAMEECVRRCAELHLEHIRTGGDPFEFGSARPLDFGHWAAHRLEIMSGCALNHGQAVAIGIALDSVYACGRGYLSPQERDLILDALQRCGLPIWSDLLLDRSRLEGGPGGNGDGDGDGNGDGDEDGNGDGDGDESGDEYGVLLGIEQFREHLGGALCVTLPQGIGARVEVGELDRAMVIAAIEFLRARAERGSAQGEGGR